MKSLFSLLVLTDFPRTLCLYFSSAVQFSMTGRPEKVARCSLSGASQAPFFAAARLLYHFHLPLSTLFSLKIRLFSRFFRESRTGGLFFAESAKSTDKGLFIKKTETSGACHAVRLSLPARLKKDDPGGAAAPARKVSVSSVTHLMYRSTAGHRANRGRNQKVS